MFEELLTQLHQDFQKHADPKTAQAMSEYLRGQFSYFGIKKPLRGQLEKKFLKNVKNQDKSAPKEVILQLWALAQREFQMTAIELIRRYEKNAPIAYIDLYESLITEKSWWDTVDMLASNAVGAHLRRHPELIAPYSEKWMNSGNIWLQRTALLFQLKYKSDTDFELLCGLIRRVAHSEEFFLRKAIGWALRQYSKFEPELVQEFLSKEKLSPLSIREASKYLK